jgi:hypothetical protein
MTSTLQPPRAPDRVTRSARRAAERRASERRPSRPPQALGTLRPRHIGVVIGLMAGGAVMLLVAALGEVAGTRVPVLTSLAELPAGDNPRLIAPKPPPPATPGTCLTWRRPDAADAEAVDCAGQHLFEQAGAVQLTDIGAGDTLPDNQKFRQLVNERCTPLVIQYLGGKYDPNGAFRAGALKPSAKRWAEGDRSLRCGLQRFSRSGALYPINGKVADQDQADIRPAGTCLGIDGRFIGDPVDCAMPHAVESVGFVDLSDKFKTKFPSVTSQDEFLQPACTQLASDYAGGAKTVSDKKLSVLWDNLTKESWDGGTRKVACNLAAQLPDKSGFAPVTGSVKGPVQVGDKPAPPARRLVPPGAPARLGHNEPGAPMDSGPEPEVTQDDPGVADERGGPPPPPARNGDDSDKLKLPDNPLNRDNPLPKDNLPRDPVSRVLGDSDDPDNKGVVPNPLGRDDPRELVPNPLGR